jgi:Na+/phosphate symporter
VCWITEKWESTFFPDFDSVFAWFLPASIRKRRARKLLESKVEALVMHNVEDLRCAALKSVERSYMDMTSQMHRSLDSVIDTTMKAIRSACSKREQQSETLADEVSHLQNHIHGLLKLEGQLKQAPESPERKTHELLDSSGREPQENDHCDHDNH